MNLLRNVNELSRGSKLLKSLKRAEEYLFSAKELNGNATGTGTGNNEQSSSTPSFKSLFQEEAKLLPSYLSKLNVASRHPVMGIARDFYGQNPSTPSLSPALQLRAIFVLLIAKSMSNKLPKATTDEDVENALLIDSKQKALSQITELLFAGHMLHKSVVDIPHTGHTDSNLGLNEGNKVATLMGDLLLAKTSRRLSELKNHTVTEIMSNTICEFSESGFIGEAISPTSTPAPVQSADNQEPGSSDSGGADNHKSDAKPNNVDQLQIHPVIGSRPILTYQNWMERSRLSLGSIIGNSCTSCMILAGQEDEDTKRFVSDLGRCVGILLQAYRDITIFENEDGVKSDTSEFIDPWTLPVILEAEQNPSLIPDNLCVSQLNHIKIFESVQSSRAAMQNSKHVLTNFQKQTINFLDQLEACESIAILHDILGAMSMKSTS